MSIRKTVIHTGTLVNSELTDSCKSHDGMARVRGGEACLNH